MIRQPRQLGHAAVTLALFAAIGAGLNTAGGKAAVKPHDAKLAVAGIALCLMVFFVVSVVLAFRKPKPATPKHTFPYSFGTTRKGR